MLALTPAVHAAAGELLLPALITVPRHPLINAD